MANALILALRLRGRARVVCSSAFAHDLYLLQSTNQRIKVRLRDQLRPGTAIVSRAFTIADWVPVAVDERRRLFLYQLGDTRSGVETWLSRRRLGPQP